MNDIKSRLKSAQAKAAVRVNSTLIYWWLGHDIVAKKKEHKWGDSVVKQLSLDLRAAFSKRSFLYKSKICSPGVFVL